MSELDVLEQGRPPMRRSVRLAVTVGVIVAVVVGYLVWHTGGRGGTGPSARSSAPASVLTQSPDGLSCLDGDTGPIYPAGAGRDAIGLALTPPSPAPSPAPSAALARVDAGADAGPWTIILRAPDGWLGTDGAVVTYPVPPPDQSLPEVGVGAVTGRAQVGAVLWPIGGGWARIRGDRSRADLVTMASATRLVNGRPDVGPVLGYQPVAALPYRSPAITEVRYDGSDLGGPGRVLGGLVYAGVVHGGGFEDRLYGTPQRPAVALVHSRIAVLSGVLGGSATLAWEVSPGVVAYIGYSGAAPSTDTTCALIQLARDSKLIGTVEWDRIAPQRVDAVNDFT